MKDYDPNFNFYAENVAELIESIKESRSIPKETIQKLQERYFGDPYKDGSQWMVGEAIKNLN